MVFAGKAFLTIDDIESSPSFAGLWSMEKKQLYELKTQLIIPMWLREQLIGFLVLSERKGGESYSQEEIDLLYTLVNNAAVETNLFPDSDSNEFLTVSVGVANYPKDGKAAEELLECAAFKKRRA